MLIDKSKSSRTVVVLLIVQSVHLCVIDFLEILLKPFVVLLDEERKKVGIAFCLCVITISCFKTSSHMIKTSLMFCLKYSLPLLH